MIESECVDGNSGSLFVVATPIGNMEDITFRAVRVLSSVGFVVAEDTRLTSRLFSHYGIKTPLMSMNEHNEFERIPKILKKIASNIDIALVSSAGTPLISDPGFRLLREAVNNSFQIIPIPGVSAVITAISAASLPSDSFLFLGFPPKKKGNRMRQLRELFFENRTLIFYESPKRIVEFISDVALILGDRHLVLSREMTKINEEFIRGKASTILKELSNRGKKVRGECTLLISGCSDSDNDVIIDDVFTTIREHLDMKNIHTLDLARQISDQYGLSKRIIYDMILKVKKGLTN